MAEQIVLQGSRRSVTGKQVRALRRAGWMPAVVYGHGVEPTAIQLNARETSNVMTRVGRASLLRLQLGGSEERPVLVRDVQRNPLTQQIIHVDFYQVRMDEKISVTIPVRWVGKAPAVREKDGVLVQGLNEIEIECLPGDLITHVDADLSSLTDIGSSLSVADLKTPAAVKVLNGLDETVAVITYQAAEEKPAEEVAVVAEVEVVLRGKKPEEEEE